MEEEEEEIDEEEYTEKEKEEKEVHSNSCAVLCMILSGLQFLRQLAEFRHFQYPFRWSMRSVQIQ